MSPEDRLEFLMFEMDGLEAELRKAEIYEVRLFSFRSDEVIRKDCLEENIFFLKKKGVIASIDEYRIIRRNLIKTVETIKGYDRDLERLKLSIDVQKSKLALIEEEKQKLLQEIEQGKKSNVLLFKRK
jgi:hypothetical protein